MRSTLKSIALVAACAATSLAASQCASSKNAPASGEPAASANAAPVATPAWSPRSTPQQIADWASASCRGTGHKQECLETALTSVITPAGVDKAMGALSILAKRDTDVADDGHVYAHGIGIAAYRDAQTVGETFARCTAEFQSGCYHGVIQAYFADSRGGDAGVSPAKLNGLCEPYRSPEKRWLEFQCAHGIGHGLMAVESHDLLRALDSCDLLNQQFDREACWGGAYMENVVNATQPHHMHVTRVADVAAHDSSRAMGGHDMAAMAGHDMGSMPGMAGMHHDEAQTFKALDPNDPLYPCDVVKEQHRRACYLMQTSAILFRNKGDFRDAAAQCAKAPEEYRSTCYISLGRDANSWAREIPQRAIGYCSAAPAEGLPYCIVGVVKNIVDVSSNPRDGMDFCKQAPDASKPACYNAVGQEIGLLNATFPGRETACRAGDSGYLAECRRGAGLPLVPGDE